MWGQQWLDIVKAGMAPWPAEVEDVELAERAHDPTVMWGDK